MILDPLVFLNAVLIAIICQIMANDSRMAVLNMADGLDGNH